MKKINYLITIVFNANLLFGAAAGKPKAKFPKEGEGLIQWAASAFDKFTDKIGVTTKQERANQQLLKSINPEDAKLALEAIKNGADVNLRIKSDDGNFETTILNQTINDSKRKIAKILLENGANPNICNSRGNNALDIWLILEVDRQKNPFNQYKYIGNQDLEILKLLLKQQAIPHNIKNFTTAFKLLNNDKQKQIIDIINQYIQKKESSIKAYAQEIGQQLIQELPADISRIVADYASDKQAKDNLEKWKQIRQAMQ